ncbi:MAG TPA: hypothetical protein VF142_12570 [Longimicrobium sp.]
MKLTLDRTLRWIWLLIGAAVLLLLIVGGVMVLAQVIGNRGASEAAEEVVEQASQPSAEDLRPVRYGEPRAVPGTGTRMILLGGGEGYGRGAGRGYGSYSGAENAYVNAVFLDAGEARLLVDRPAFIRRVHLPGDGQTRADSAAPWIAYVMALEDGNGDGAVDAQDPAALYVTDREGRNLRAVVRPPLRYEWHQALDASRLLVYALEPTPRGRTDPERMRQRAFVYDVASGQLTPYAALDSAAARAARILGR